MTRHHVAGMLLGLVSLGPLGLFACTQLRYTDSFSPDLEVKGVKVSIEAGSVEVVPSDVLRVERAVHGPKGGLDLQHTVRDDVLELTARCRPLLPCEVHTTIGVPLETPVKIDVGRGEVWVTGVGNVGIELGVGKVDLDVNDTVYASVGVGTVHANLPRDATARIAVGDGDIEVRVPAGSWNIEATGRTVSTPGIEHSDSAKGQLELVAPAGEVRVLGRSPLAAREG